MLPTASILMRAVVVGVQGRVTACAPSLAVAAARTVGKVLPPSSERRMFTVAATDPPPTSQVTFVLQPQPRTSPPLGAVTRKGAPAKVTTIAS